MKLWHAVLLVLGSLLAFTVGAVLLVGSLYRQLRRAWL